MAPAAASGGREPRPKKAITSKARATPIMSCITLQLRSASSVARLVVRRRLRVMLMTTTLDDSATDRPTRTAPRQPTPNPSAAAPTTRVVTSTCTGAVHKTALRLRISRTGSISMPTSKQEQHHADIRQKLELTPVGDITRRERRYDQ